MRRRHLGIALTILSGALPQLGCQTFSPMPPAPAAAPASPLGGLEAPLDAPRSPDDAGRLCLHAAELYDKSGKEAEAIHGYEMARQHNPKLTQVSRRLAVLYDRQGDFTKAQDEYAKALKLSPNDSDLLNDYGYFLYQQERYPEAEEWLLKAVKANPKNRRAVINRGMAVGQQRRYADAFNIFAGAVGTAEAHANMGYIYSTQGRREEAMNAYREALALNPNLKQAQAALDVLAANPNGPRLKEPAEFPANPAASRANEHTRLNGIQPTISRAPASRPSTETPVVTRERNPEEVYQRLSNFRKEQNNAEAVQAVKRPEVVAPPEQPQSEFTPATSRSGLFDPAAERETTPPPEAPKRFIQSVKPITIPTPRSPE
jgi:Tfp pilus assembly protein PilF